LDWQSYSLLARTGKWACRFAANTLELSLDKCPYWLIYSLVVAAIAYQISHRRSFAFLSGLFTACDGIFLVESRYALNNIYIVIFGLLGQWFLLLGLEKESKKRLFG
jgi:hypothetical protein